MSAFRFVLVAAAVAAGAAQAATDADLLRCRARADGAARLACYDALPLAPGGSATAAPAAQFGFEARAALQGSEMIESRIAGTFEGWGPRSLIRLENGQVWQVSDDSRSLMVPTKDPKVRVTRASFGTFFMEVEGKRQAPRVKRVE